MKTTAPLTYEKIRFDQAKDVHLVVSLAAPHLAATAPRPPVCVVPCHRRLRIHGGREAPLRIPGQPGFDGVRLQRAMR